MNTHLDLTEHETNLLLTYLRYTIPGDAGYEIRKRLTEQLPHFEISPDGQHVTVCYNGQRRSVALLTGDLHLRIPAGIGRLRDGTFNPPLEITLPNPTN